MYNNREIIITLTSWPKRISNVYYTIKSLLKNDVLPDKIFINLALDEFPNKENDLPNELLKLMSENENIIIQWLKHNTYTFKKLIPTIKYLKTNNYKNPAYILTVDDDKIYNQYYIHAMCDFIYYYDAVTLHDEKIFIGDYTLVGNRSIYKLEIFDDNFLYLLEDTSEAANEIINTKQDDIYYTVYLSLKNKKINFLYFNKLSFGNIIETLVHTFNDDFALSNNGKYQEKFVRITKSKIKRYITNNRL